MREKINLEDNIEDVIFKMSEGNPGGLTVLIRLMKEFPDGLMLLLDLDDMNIRGPQIHVGFKDICGGDLNKFKELIVKRDTKLVNGINDEMMADPNWKERAYKNRYEKKWNPSPR